VSRWVKSKNDWWQWCSNRCMGLDPEIIAKKEQSNQAKFGGHPMKNPSILANRNATYLSKYGVENPFSNEEVKNKIKKTNLEKLGVENPSHNQSIVEKIRARAQQRYADTECKEQILSRRKATNIEKFGVESNKFQHISSETLLLMNDIEWLKNQHYELKKSLEQIAKELNISAHPLWARFKAENLSVKRYNESQVQKEILQFIETLTTEEIVVGDRTVISPKELDIYIPTKNLAIEINGVYWHSEEQGKDKQYHLDKTKQCEKKNIHLIQIYDIEWTDLAKQKIVKSKIQHLFGQSNKVAARKCKIQIIDNSQSSVFLEQNHLQGNCPSTIKLGLFYQEELFAVATFGRPRFNKEYQWELLRYATKINSTVVGGLSKIFKEFTKLYNGQTIISYADRRWSCAHQNIYKLVGFEAIGESAPNYKYFQANHQGIKLLSRNQFQKHLLPEKLEIFDPSLTESENMALNNYHRIWDCGNLVFAWKQLTSI